MKKIKNYVKGYKVFEPNWTCGDFQYEVGKAYETGETPICCRQGFHFYKHLKDCLKYCDFDSKCKFAEVVALGDIDKGTDGRGYCTNIIKIEKELLWSDILEKMNFGEGCTDIFNIGDNNTGNCNIGDHNTGNCNAGYFNTGNYNSGSRNIGIYNTGFYNIGDHNTGDCNIGDHNAVSYNIGNYNAGFYNIGNRNTGDFNQSNYCTGDFNLVDNETGCFCTEEHKIRIFDKDSNLTYNEWENSYWKLILGKFLFIPVKWIKEDCMTEEEKKSHPEYKTTGGYLKKNDITKSYSDWWENLDDKEKYIITTIPNFDADKFKMITGIDVN